MVRISMLSNTAYESQWIICLLSTKQIAKNFETILLASIIKSELILCYDGNLLTVMLGNAHWIVELQHLAIY